VTVAGLLLAAGAGTRIGGPKALLQVGGRSLVERGVSLLHEGGCAPIVVVVGAQAGDVAPLVGAQHADVHVVVATDWADGLGASLRAGLTALEPGGATACVVALVDQPLVGSEAVCRLLAVGDEVDAAVATYDGQPRNPVRLSRRVWADVGGLAISDTGARAWLQANPDRVMHIPCDGTGSAADIDTPDDLAAVRAALGN
jgi:CTP:molybdopterin cytidylyltransferase MocA